MHRTFIGTIVLLAGCQPGVSGPWESGLTITGTQTKVVTTKPYIHVAGAQPFESKGFRSQGDTCGEAQQSAGRRTTTVEETTRIRYHSFGTTLTQHVLGFDSDSTHYPMSVIEEQYRSMSSTETLDVDFTDDGEEQRIDVEPEVEATWANFAGLFGDAYLIKQDPLDQWDPLVQLGGEGVPEPSAEQGGDTEPDGDAFDPRRGTRVLTKLNPSEGDVWTDYEGRTVYTFVREESLPAAGRDRTANRVDVRRIADVDPVGEGAASVLDACVMVKDGRRTVDEFDEDEGDTVTRVEDYKEAFLDQGCFDGFLAEVQGTEWWDGPILVRAEYDIVDVRRPEGQTYGYLFFDEDEAGCRIDPRVEDDDFANGERPPLFVVYEVTTTRVTWVADGIVRDGEPR